MLTRKCDRPGDARRARVAELLLLEKLSIRDIAERLTAEGIAVTKSTVDRDVAELRAGWRSESATAYSEHIEAQLGELKALKDAIRAEALNKKSEKQLLAIDRMVKLLERESKLLGLDRPQAVDVTSAGKALGEMSPEEIERRAIEILSQRAGDTPGLD